jgi:hypothetical protein
MDKNPLFHIFCPCKCGRAIGVEFKPTKTNEKFIAHIDDLSEEDIENLGNLIWKRVVEARGLEGAIQFLHDQADS